MTRFALSLFAAGFAGLAALLFAALLAMPADEARADDGHPGSNHALHRAAGRDGDLAVVVHLLGSAHGWDVNARDSHRRTPLHYAASNNRAAIAAELIAAGADVNAKDFQGYTPLAVARPAVRAVLLANCTNGFVVNPAGQCICVSPKVETNRGRCEVVAVCDSPAALDAAANRCDCPAPNVGADGAVAPGNCAAPSESVCAGLNPPLSYDSSMGECILTSASCTAATLFYNGTDCVPFKPCADGALDRETNTCECAGAAVLDARGTGCLCESPNVETAAGCQAPSAQVCGELNPPEFFNPTRVSITAGECVPFLSCPTGAALDRETNTCEFSAESCAAFHDPPLLYDSNTGECGDQIYPCHDSAIRKADNSGCECPEGAYAHGDPSGGRWVRLCENYSYVFERCNRYGEWRKSIPAWAECHADHAPISHSAANNSALGNAVRNNNPTLVAHYVGDHGLDPDGLAPGYGDRYHLHLAAKHDSHLAALALIEGGADVNRAYPLHDAVRNSSFQTAKVLLNRGANPDAVDSDGDTALHEAVRLTDEAENVVLVSLLLDKGADPNIRNRAGWRPLDSAYQGWRPNNPAWQARRKMMAALIAGGATWSDECSGGAIPNENYQGAAEAATYPRCGCPAHLSQRDSFGKCECPDYSHAQVNGRCLAKDSAQVQLEIAKMRLELERLRTELTELNRRLTLLSDAPATPPETLEEVAKQAEVAARGIARRRNNFLALARAGLAEADDAGPAPTLALSDTEATCRMLDGEVQTHSRTGAKICSGIDHNDTFCIVGSALAFPCVGFFRHVRRCNDDHNRPALDPWHCAAPCPSGLRARGARCEPES